MVRSLFKNKVTVSFVLFSKSVRGDKIIQTDELNLGLGCFVIKLKSLVKYLPRSLGFRSLGFFRQVVLAGLPTEQEFLSNHRF